MKEINDIVAERIFHTNSGKIIKVIIGRPQKDLEYDNFICRFQLQGFRSSEIREAWGVDSAQALIIAFQNAAALLHTSEEGVAKNIKWVGSEGRDMIGFPIAETLLDLVGLKFINDDK